MKGTIILVSFILFGVLSAQWVSPAIDVYRHLFLACPNGMSYGSCARSDEFAAKQSTGRCELNILNGDGHGMDEVKSYAVQLNGKRVQVGEVSLLSRNKIRVTLDGVPHSKIVVRIACPSI